MCKNDPNCTKVDHPLLAALLTDSGHKIKSSAIRRADWLVCCPMNPEDGGYDVLAAIFTLPTVGEVLCLPADDPLRRSVFVDPANPHTKVHFHATLDPLSSYEADWVEHGRCHHGTWCFRPAEIKDRLFGRQNGKPYTLGSWVSMADEPDSIRRRHADPSSGT